MINTQHTFSYRSRICFLLSSIFLPNVEKALFKRGYFVTNKEMYAVEADRKVANPVDLDHKNVRQHDVMRRNAMVSKLRREIFNHACVVGFALNIALTVGFAILFSGVATVSNGIHAVISEVSHMTSSSSTQPQQTPSNSSEVEALKAEAAQAAVDLKSGKITPEQYEAKKADLIKRYTEFTGAK